MATLIQICASHNDLFGLDSDGVVHQYNFNTSTWISIGRGRTESESPQAQNTLGGHLKTGHTWTGQTRP
jgi:hypothetical protein